MVEKRGQFCAGPLIPQDRVYVLRPACQCARFSLKNGLYRPLNPPNFRCAALEGEAAPPPSRQIATLTATIIHAPLDTPVDVPG